MLMLDMSVWYEDVPILQHISSCVRATLLTTMKDSWEPDSKTSFWTGTNELESEQLPLMMKVGAAGPVSTKLEPKTVTWEWLREEKLVIEIPVSNGGESKMGLDLTLVELELPAEKFQQIISELAVGVVMVNFI
mmetsp:Transcript_8676/g.19682  ORF Transcript_8676/g.19682 Transcript_8676/m.19682 type:complete len:134 (-) Transcript_8676:648-1049(-)